MNGTAASSNSTGSKKTTYSKGLSSSSTGWMQNKSRILSAPYKVTQCDQVIEVSGKTLTDMNDFSNKTEKFFTLSTYLVNQFEKKDAAALSKSINVEKIKRKPHIIQGSLSCIEFNPGNDKDSINICLNTAEEAKNLIKSFDVFSKCRDGHSVGGNTNNLIKILEESCKRIYLNLIFSEFFSFFPF